jgi:hypothetical protein
MKTLANRIVLFAAAAVVLGSTAYGQTTMKADIPFAFHAANTTLPAGSYTLIRETTSGVVRVQFLNAATQRSVLSWAGALDLYTDGTPRLLFVCGDSGGCSLHQIRSEAGTVSYPLPRQEAHSTKAALTISIPLTAHNGD